MLFEPQGAALVDKMFRDASLALNRQRKREAAKRLDFYHDGQLEHLQEALALKFADPSKLQPCFINIVKKIVDLKSRCYADEPKRTIDGSESDKALFQEIAEQSALSVKMKTASRLTKLLKTTLIRPVWRNNRLDLDVLTPDIIDVDCGESPEDLETILVTHYPDDDKVEGITYSLWTADAWQKLDYRGRVLDGGPNPYKILPFVPLWDRAPSDAFWIAGGEDLIVCQEAVNKALTDLLHTLEFQSFGVGYVTGVDGGGNLQTGPGTMVELPKDASLGFAATNAQIEEATDAIDRIMKWCAVSNGLPGSSMSVDPTDESGISKIVGNAELSESRQDDIALWRGYEKCLFAVIRSVWNAHNPTRRLSDAATLTTDFADPKPETSEKDQAATWQILMDLGLISPVDAALERNPDLGSRENALAYLIQVRDETAALNENKI